MKTSGLLLLYHVAALWCNVLHCCVVLCCIVWHCIVLWCWVGSQRSNGSLVYPHFGSYKALLLGPGAGSYRVTREAIAERLATDMVAAASAIPSTCRYDAVQRSVGFGGARHFNGRTVRDCCRQCTNAIVLVAYVQCSYV